MSCLETYATLRVISKALPPAEISRILGIEPTMAQPIDPGSKYQYRRERHYWAWSSQGRASATDGAAHIRAVIELLKGKDLQVSALRQAGCELDIFCYWSSSGQGGPALDATNLAALAHLGLPIAWDIYFDEPTDSE